MYKVIRLNEYGKSREPEQLIKWLNEMEKEGWNLVGITNHNYSGYWVFHKTGEKMNFTKEELKKLVDQIGEHSSNICYALVNLESRSPLIEEMTVQNSCIQDILVSVSDLYLS